MICGLELDEEPAVLHRNSGIGKVPIGKYNPGVRPSARGRKLCANSTSGNDMLALSENLLWPALCHSGFHQRGLWARPSVSGRRDRIARSRSSGSLHLLVALES